MQKEEFDAENLLVKGLLPHIVLRLIRARAMHGYEIISRIRQTYHQYFGPSTIYPLLNKLEDIGKEEGKNLLTSKWDLGNDRPRKVYSITARGEMILGLLNGIILREIREGREVSSSLLQQQKEIVQTE